jgi:hypothetical protein
MPASLPGRLDSSAAGRYLACLVLLALLLLCALLLRQPETPATRPAAVAPAIAASQGTDTLADQQWRREVARLGPIQRHGVDGAELYTEAMALYNHLSDADRQTLQAWNDNWLTDPHWGTDPKLRANAGLFARILPILSLLRQARHADYVDWGFDPSNRNGATQLWVLSEVGLWGAAYQFQSDPRSAVADLADVQALVRNITGNTWMLGFGYGFDPSIYTLLAQNVPQLPQAPTADLKSILDPTAAMQFVQHAIDSEVAADQEMIDQYTNPATQYGSSAALRDQSIPRLRSLDCNGK